MDTVPQNVPDLITTADRALSGISAVSEKTEVDSLSKIDKSTRPAEPAHAESQSAEKPERLSLDTEPDTADTDTTGKLSCGDRTTYMHDSCGEVLMLWQLSSLCSQHRWLY